MDTFEKQTQDAIKAGARDENHAHCFVCNWCDELFCIEMNCYNKTKCAAIANNLKGDKHA